MTTDLQFTNDEWEQLFELPPLMGTAMMLAGRSGLGSFKEAMAIASNVISGERAHPDNPIITRLGAMRRDGIRSQVEQLGGEYRKLTPDDIRQRAIDKLRQVRFLVRQKASPEVAAEYLQWILQISQRVAEAAKEGGFLGIGGERVSADERGLLEQLQQEIDA